MNIWGKFFQGVEQILRRRKPPATELPSVAVEHKIASPVIVKGYVRVVNGSDLDVVLTGGALKRLTLKAKSWADVRSPILEDVMRAKEVWIGGQRGIVSELAYINEWDALHVVENMIEEYARSRAYDLMTPDELRVCTLPLPKRALAGLIEKIGLKAQRI